ncbi:beta-lactamase [Thauera linaloolentis 47Lol = DSM 12138]|uniref:Beta-lactamase n=2 Tax=Thauera linaloolentis TaxID=76112 RepID=N6YMI1_THAL4|nr:beta-lactamase [Thauera linaloolentis 47Lol = DSM 12138]
MGAVLVASQGKVLFSRGYGAANLEWDVANTPLTKFRIGSVTKQFTAAAVLLLEQDGKLRLKDRVSAHWPQAPAAWKDITVFHLLTHTSGIPNYTAFPEFASLQVFDTPVEKIVEGMRNRPLDFTPGSKYDYSNSGYVLLGWLIERISGQRYGDFVRDRIFEPLGMQDSGYDSNTAIIERRAAGYERRRDQPLANAGFVHMSTPHAAGALYSTAEDLLRWAQGLFGGTLLSAESLKKMTTPYKGGYALGLEVKQVDGHEVIEHDGAIDGFDSFLSYYPAQKVVVIVLSNVAGGRRMGDITRELAALAVGRGEQP